MSDDLTFTDGLVYHGDKVVGRVFNRDAFAAAPPGLTWFWGLSFPYAQGKDYGNAATREDAETAFRERWKLRTGGSK